MKVATSLFVSIVFIISACQNETTTNISKHLVIKEIKCASQSGGEGNLFVDETDAGVDHQLKLH